MRFKYYLRGAGIGVIAATLVLSVAFLFHDNISDEEVIRRAMKLGMIMQENKPGTLADPPQSGASSVDLETGADPQDSVRADDDPLSDAEKDTQDPSSGSDPSADQDPSSGDDSQSGNDPSGTQKDPSSGADASSDPSGGSDTSPSTDKPSSGDSGKKEDADKPSDKKTDSDKPSKKDPADSKPKDSSDEDEVEIVIASGDVSRMVSAKVFEAGLVDDADEFNSYLGSNDYDNMLQPGTYKIKKGSSFRQIAQILTRQ